MVSFVSPATRPWVHALLIAAALSPAVLAQGTWSVFDTSNAPFPSNQVLEVAYDPATGMYALASPNRIFRYHNGVWQDVPFDTNRVRMFGGMVPDNGRLWLGTPWYGLARIDSAYATGLYDTTNSCLPGSDDAPLGLDRDGQLLVYSGRWYGLGGTALGLLRFDGTTCQPIDIGPLMGTSYQVRSYSRDSSGVEWFGVVCAMDVPSCGELGGVYALRNDTLRRALAGEYWLGATPIVSDSRATYAGYGTRIAVFANDTVELTSIRANPPNHGITSMLVDSRGALWVGAEGYTYDTAYMGVARIAGGDTLTMNHLNSGFGGYFAWDMAEDDSGRIWFATYLKGLWVFTYDDTSAAQPHAAVRRAPAASARAQARVFDVRGRLLANGRPSPGVRLNASGKRSVAVR